VSVKKGTSKRSAARVIERSEQAKLFMAQDSASLVTTFRPPMENSHPCGASVWMPFRLDNSLNGPQGNSSGSAFVRRKKRREHNEVGFALAKTLIMNGIASLPDNWIIEFTRGAPIGLDDDNVVGSFKSIRDGMADMFAFDDGSSTCWWAYHQTKTSRKDEVPYFVHARIFCPMHWMQEAYGFTHLPTLSSRRKIFRCE
jgi:hypothetical protein